ncbi:MAG TPA: hypothetical protein PLG49_02385 [Defluviitaleaceae bacterium]|nr:hypothetical protein [Defluviitaleaceae bacterium]
MAIVPVPVGLLFLLGLGGVVIIAALIAIVVAFIANRNNDN